MYKYILVYTLDTKQLANPMAHLSIWMFQRPKKGPNLGFVSQAEMLGTQG